VAIAPLKNDTALYADFILPPLFFMETRTTAGDRPVKPFVNGMHAGDFIIGIAKRVEETKTSMLWNSFFDVINLYGRIFNTDGRFYFHPEYLKKEVVKFNKTAESKFPLLLIPFEIPCIGDGDGLASPYVLKTIDSDVFSDGKMYVHINRATAKNYGITENESLDIKSERGKVGSVYAHLTDTIAPDVVSVPLGFGHNAYTRYAEDKGVNPREIMNNSIDPLTGTANWWITRIKIS